MKSNTPKFGALLGAAILGLLGLRANAQPSVFNCSESANPGDAITIQGDSFGNSPQVWMLHVTGTESSLTPKTRLTVLSSTGSLNATGSNSYVSALIPDTETPGLYAIWVSADGGTTFGQGVYVNQASPWNAVDLCGSAVDPSRQFHLYGRNLRFSGTGTPTVSFVSGSTSLAATVASGTDPYVLSVTAPSGLAGGVNYSLTVNNGFGGNYGNVTGPALTGTITSGTDPFGIGVPWGADFATYSSRTYTVPFVSSTTDMTSAIQTAINAVSGSGGGVVALQSGTYKISPSGSAYLNMMTKVVIQGAGMNQTVLMLSSTSAYPSSGYGIYDNGNNLIDCGLADLTVYNTPSGAPHNLSFVHGNHAKFFAVRTQFKADVGTAIYYSGTQAVINNCVIAGGTGNWYLSGTSIVQSIGQPVNITSVTNAVFKNNLIDYYAGRVCMGNGGAGILVQSNTFSRIAYSGTYLYETGGLGVQQTQDIVVLGNLFQKDPILSGTNNFQNYDGETILCQTGGCRFPCHGNVSSSGSNTLTDTNQNWTNNYGVIAASDYQMYYVTIVSGPGAGQIRKIIGNTTTTLTVDTPWQVLPAAGSVYNVNHIESLRHLVKDNSLNNNVQGICYYSVSVMDSAFINNTFNDNGGVYLRSDYRPSTTGTFQIQMNNIVAGNSVTRTSSNPYTATNSRAYVIDWICVTGTNYPIPGTSVFCTEFRGNTITAPVPSGVSGLGGEGFGLAPQLNGVNPITDGSTAVALGVVFQNNTAVSCSNAFHIGTGDYNTTIWNNVVSGTGATLLYDGTGSGMTHASVASTYGCLTGFWSFDAQNAQDTSGNLDNGTLVGNPTFSTDVSPRITATNAHLITFSGTNYVQVNNAAAINPCADMTIAFWMKSGTTGAYGRILSKDGESAGSPGWEITRGGVGSNSIMLRLDSSASLNQTDGISNCCDGTWHYIAYVVCGSTVYSYLDGSLVMTRGCIPGNGFGNSGLPLLMGAALGGTSPNYIGQLDQVQIYDHALSGAQILNLYNYPQ